MTGSTFFNPELSAKRLEMLKETISGLTDAVVLMNPGNIMNTPVMPEMRKIADPLKLELHQFGANAPADFAAPLRRWQTKRIGALVVLDDANLLANARTAALRSRSSSGCHRCGWTEYAVEGGLFSYGVDFNHLFRASRDVRRQDFARQQAGRSAVRARNEIRDRGQSQDREGARRRGADSVLLRADNVIE